MSQNGTSATLQIDNGTPFDVALIGTVPIFPSQVNPSLTTHTATFRVTGPCGVSICTVQFTCGPVPPVQGESGQCVLNVTPQTGDCSTQFVATWTSSGLASPHLLLDGADLGVVPAIGSFVLPSTGSGSHTVKLIDLSNAANGNCQAAFTVTPSGEFPSCRNSATPSAGFLDTQFDLCFFAGNANRVDLFVDGVLKCTQLNPVAGQKYDCYVLGSDVGPGVHVVSIIATGCGGTCTKGTPFRVFNSTSGK
jgi:hypothetical protein